MSLTVGVLVVWGAVGRGQAPRPVPAGQRQLLLELFTSQGCNMCPDAEELVDKLTRADESLIPMSFHVDYFNEPWKDPFSNRQFSARQWQYSILYDTANKVGKKDYLYFTPMLMVDGRYPMLGSDQAKAQRTIRQAKSERPGVQLVLGFSAQRSADRKTLRVTIEDPLPSLVGKEVLVGVAITEDPVTTKVESGENGGKTLVEHHVVRDLKVKPVSLSRSGPVVQEFELSLGKDWVGQACRVVAYVQDETNGRIHQAGRISWTEGASGGVAGR